ncbi:hypothetical protein EMCG_03588 [[Emmonsia] crescens]|uniref:Uncharacterized protein n=1 Tax=[Emmonsia] crescens TaxID=73230 RepID=A0A0G2J003_9EURO|nr:hypothetical protein EMCG_03588 [Emmonsia crescens UAMH 3008]
MEDCMWESVEDTYTVIDTDGIKPNKPVEEQQSAEPKAVDESELSLDVVVGQYHHPELLDDTPLVSCQSLGNDLWDPEDPAKLDGQDIDVAPPAMQEQTGTLDPENLEFGEDITLVTSPLLRAESALLTTANIDNATKEAVTPLAIPTSRLLFPTLEGDDADFITDFLSQAQAKRAAAKSAMPSNESENASWEDPAPSPTPRARRVLEDLDKNSPSSPRQQVSSSKPRQPPVSPSPKTPPAIDPEQGEIEQEEQGQEIREETEDQQQPRVATPWRRSTRKNFSRTQRHTPTVPNHIPVRRSNGTEFVFLQRSEEQQLSLTTKANTRRNKGDAQFPCFVLQAINAKEYDPSGNSNGDTGGPASPRKSPRKRIRIVKKVMWDEEHLVQYEGETYENEEQSMEIGQGSHSPKPAISQPAKRERKKKNQDPNTTSNSDDKSKLNKQPVSTQSDPQPAKSPTVMKKVRKLGFSGNSDPSKINHTSTTAATAPASTKISTATRKIASSHPGTPIQRKKLAPKSIVFKVSDDRASKISIAATTGSTTTSTGNAAPTTRAAAKKFGSSCLPRNTGRTRM